jgi:hypothetical protein
MVQGRGVPAPIPTAARGYLQDAPLRNPIEFLVLNSEEVTLI